VNKIVVFGLTMLVAAYSWALDIKRSEGELKELPALFIDVGACPFECCTYRAWKVKTNVDLFEKPNGTKIVGKLTKGEDVVGLTGEVHAKPILVSVLCFQKGDTFYVLTYLGEGFFRAWFDSKMFQISAIGVKNLFQYYSKDRVWPEASQRYDAVWWQKVKTKSGIVGWAKENAFSGQDACG